MPDKLYCSICNFEFDLDCSLVEIFDHFMGHNVWELRKMLIQKKKGYR